MAKPVPPLYTTDPCKKCGGTVRYVSSRACRACNAIAAMAHRSRLSPEVRRQKNRANHLKVYGMTPVQFDALLASQGGVCAICKTDKPANSPDNNRWWHVDHDHDTGAVRGILCGQCNSGLGFFKDSAKRVVAAAYYLAGSYAKQSPAEELFPPPSDWMLHL